MVNNDKPLISFVIVAYKQERFIAEAVMGAFSQTYSPLEIILSDDCSPDRTHEIMEQMLKEYSGPHQVILNRTSHNLGLSGHINEVVKLATGELIVVAAGDDISNPKRTEKIVEAFLLSNKKAMSIYSNAIIINEKGDGKGMFYLSTPNNSLYNPEYMAGRITGVLGCTHAWHRSIFELFGPLNNNLIQEDIVIAFRSALVGNITYISEPLVKYRIHETNLYAGKIQDVWKSQDFKERQQKALNSWRTVCYNRLADLMKMEEISPQNSDRNLRIRSGLEFKLQELEYETSLYTTNSASKKLNIILSAWRKNISGRVLIRWLLQSFYPRLWVIIFTAYRYFLQIRFQFWQSNAPNHPIYSNEDYSNEEVVT